MASYAQIDSNGKVVNVIEAEPDYVIKGFSLVLAEHHTWIGGTYIDGVFSEHPALKMPVPKKIPT